MERREIRESGVDAVYWRPVRDALAELVTELSPEDIEQLLDTPPDPSLGDVAFPTFRLAKERRRPPAEIARTIAEALSARGFSARADGGYVNVALPRTAAVRDILRETAAPDFARFSWGAGKRVVIDMSSPNIAKPFGVGHLRSTVIGQAIRNLLLRARYEVLRVNHIGDWGTQFGKLMAAYAMWGIPEGASDKIRAYLELYVRFHEEAERRPELEDEGRRWFKRLEDGDPQARKLWRMFVDESLKEFMRIYDRLGVSFEYILGESFYNDQIPGVLEEVRAKGLLEESEGAFVVRLGDDLPPALLLKSDGTTLYLTRDLATALYRKNVLGGDLLLYVVGREQSLHFEQLRGVLRRMGYPWADAIVHVPFGLLRFGGKKLSTRRGRVIFLEEVLDEAKARALQILEEKSPHLADKEGVAEAIGVGAVIFNDLRQSRLHDIDFDMEEALSFEGETGPYVQYTYARAKSLFRRAGAACEEALADVLPDVRAIAGDRGWELLKLVAAYPRAVRKGIELYEPSAVARHILDVAKAFNRYYQEERILVEDPEERRAKLALVARVARVLADGLDVLGLKVLEEI
ncbi:MAG: Arginyl-tRNA synthetase [Brockia lithotrophica]|uniref:Arginine--tRNA ligase n=1 Tax=Brockia lithotrophica TaxID=933949 RepID=A0A2T5G8H2_9BACL|nr:MAG: Arginyl-tRNA synthetase [Brockia lithotrophica]